MEEVGEAPYEENPDFEEDLEEEEEGEDNFGIEDDSDNY